MSERLVKDIMTKGVIHVAPDCPLRSLVTLMQKNRISCVVVCREETPIGIVTERDLPRAVRDREGAERTIHTAQDLMSSPVQSVSSEETIQNATAVAQNSEIRHLPVVDSTGRLVGITTQTDLLRCYNAELESLVAARTAEAAMAVAKLESANEAKSRFLANMCHEIRTPMTAIVGFADFLIEDGDLVRAPADRLDSLHAIKRNSKHLLRVLGDILDMAKIDSGKIELESLPVMTLDLAEDVGLLFQALAEEKGISLQVQYDGLLPERIMTDPTRLRQILMNLVGNAIKFTEQGGVLLTLRLVVPDGSEPMLEFCISDTGCGISPEDLERVFDPFSQGDGSTTRRYGGSGLGLPISKELAELLGGDIEVESAEGRGSTFTLSIRTGPIETIPLVDPSAQSPAERERTDTVSSGAYLRQVKAANPKGSILVVEDGSDNRRLIRSILERVGFEVSVAENGRVGVDLALAACEEGRPFDVILMDMQMPVLDGYSATRELRTAGYALPIVALTAHAMKEDRTRCMIAGCDDYVSKPIKRRQLIDAILGKLTKS